MFDVFSVESSKDKMAKLLLAPSCFDLIMNRISWRLSSVKAKLQISTLTLADYRQIFLLLKRKKKEIQMYN